MKKLASAVALFLAALVLAGCFAKASTSFEKSWVEPQYSKKTYQKVLIISVAADEFVQQYVQQQMAAQLKARGVNAVASGAYFSRDTPAERARFERAIKSSGADAVIFVRAVEVDTKTKESPGTIIGPNGMPYADAVGVYGAYARYFYPGSYAPGGESETRTVTAEASLYERAGHALVWTGRTRTENANKGELEPAAAQFVSVLVAAMERDRVF